jgi:hypothetical protein
MNDFARMIVICFFLAFFDQVSFSYYLTLKGLTRAQYTHEFMTNYDIDEIIFPRAFDTFYNEEIYKNNRTNCASEITVFHELNQVKYHQYNIYQYAKRLKNKYPLTANFHFEHVLFLAEYDMFYDLLVEAVQNKTDYIQYNGKYGCKLNYSLKKDKDYEYTRSLIAAMDFSRCLNRTFLQKLNGTIDPLWTRSVGTIFNNRAGKSIFDTEYTSSINQHFTNSVKSGGHATDLPISFGFVSHFRNIDVFSQHGSDNILRYTIREVQVDVEYLYFLVNISSRFQV